VKNLKMVFAALLIGAVPVVAPVALQKISEERSIQDIDPRLGVEAVALLRSEYQKGAYASFLKEMDVSYKEALANHSLDSLNDMRKGVPSDWEGWEEMAQALQHQKGKELANAIQNEQDSIFISKVKSISASLTTPEQQRAIAYIASLRQLPLGSGENQEENALIALDLEYEYKALHLNVPGSSNLDQRDKHLILRMEHLDKMTQLAKSFHNKDLQQKVALFSQNFDERMAQSWDLIDLNRFVKGTVAPQNGLEEKVASILKLYQEKMSDLTGQFLAKHSE
jgi:hypothetical protein